MKESEILDRLEEKRKAEGMTQAEMAETLGYSREIYNKWVNRRVTPDQRKLIDIFSFLTGKKTLIIKNDREDPEYLSTPVEWVVGEDVEHVTGNSES